MIHVHRPWKGYVALGLTMAIGVTGGGVVIAIENQPGTPTVADRVETQTPSSSSAEPWIADPATLAQRATLALGLKGGAVVELDVDRTPNQALTVPITIEGQPFTMALAPHSIRAAEYQVRAQLADGTYVDVDPGINRMLRGSLFEAPGSRIAGGLLNDGLHVAIRMNDGQRYWVQPLIELVAGASPAHHIVYRDQDVIGNGGTCGTDAAIVMNHPLPEVDPQDLGAGGTDGGTVYCAELGVDADVEYFTDYGTITNVENRINLVINTMNLQYLNEVDIQHAITTIIVRTAEPDPYSSTDAGTLLGQFANHWQSSQAGVPRDVAQLFTGKALDGSTIGIAATIGGICTTSAYCLVESDCCGGLACATDLSAHEFGHLWGAFHCSSACSSTMNPSITCVNTFLNSSPSSVSAIVAHRDSRSCLGSCADATLPFFDDFPAVTFDTAKWASISGATVSTVGSNEPSAPNSMRLRGSSGGGQQARTARIDTSNLGLLQLQYYYQQTGGGSAPGNGEDLVVEYYSPAGTWVEVSRQLGSGPSMTTFAQATVNFPPDAFHSEFRLRFRNTSVQNNTDDWFVDNINVTGVAIPANNSCANAILKGSGSHAFTTLASSTDGPNEPGSCNFNGYTHMENDVWFKVLAQCTGTMTIILCGANFNTKMAVYPSCPSGAGEAIACNDDSCGTSSEISFPVVFNTLYRVRIGGFNGATGSGTMVVSCTPVEPPACPADLTDDNQVGTPDLLALINAWGACPGCPADLSGDNVVGTPDLLALINAWGPCPN